MKSEKQNMIQKIKKKKKKIDDMDHRYDIITHNT